MKPFHEFTLAVASLEWAINSFIHANHLDRKRKKEIAEEKLNKLNELIDRLFAIGLPKIKPNYPNGQIGWEFDVKKTFEKLREQAKNYLQLAIPLPELRSKSVYGANLEQYRKDTEERRAGITELQRKRHKLRQLTNELFTLGQWVCKLSPKITAQPLQSPQQEPQDEKKPNLDNKLDGKKKKSKGKGINERLAGLMIKKPESISWSAQRIADHLGCTKSTVAESLAWKKLLILRNLEKENRAERLKRSNGNNAPE